MDDERLNYLYGLERFGIKLGLEVITELLNILGNPHRQYKSVHIAGTNGKGSTAAFVAQILQEAGYTVGLYTSPHLVKFNERIKMSGEDISAQDLINLITVVKEKVELNHLQPTFFEFTTAMAFLYFAQKKVDIVVIETGMGGRLDATNVLQPEVAIITNISLDHQRYLGETKEKIAVEKAGIIKPNCPLITAEENEEIINIFKKRCSEQHSELWKVSEHINLETFSLSLQKLSFTTSGVIADSFSTKMLGIHQLQNATTALLAAAILQSKGIRIPGQALRDGIHNTYWPGRMEIMNEQPAIIVDGAHNVAGMKAVKKFVEQFLRPKVLLLGISKDKQIEEMISIIAPLAKTIIISSGNYKPVDMKVIEKECRKYSTAKIFKMAEVKEAMLKAWQETRREDLLLITGSLYLVGDVLTHRELFLGRWDE